MSKTLLLTVLLGLLAVAVGFRATSRKGAAKSFYVSRDERTNGFRLRPGQGGKDSLAVGTFSNAVNQTGWAQLEITTNSEFDDTLQAYYAGAMEGHLTRDLIGMHWHNTYAGYCASNSTYCTRLADYFKKNLAWLQTKMSAHYDDLEEAAYWHQVQLLLLQVAGVQDGYNGDIKEPNMDVDIFGLFLIQADGDIEDLESALQKDGKRETFVGDGHCSALVKLLPDLSDLYVSQDTWSSYQTMLRVLKVYRFAFHMTADDQSGANLVPGQMVSFSSYPARVFSGDDFHIMDTGLVSMETTIGNGNSSLWQYVQPEGQVLEWMRTMIANRLARTGAEWAGTFAKYNSGTYNNQWMIVDYKRFAAGVGVWPGVLTVLEQLPSLIVWDDQTDLLKNQTYWPSYNIAFYKSVFNLSGGQASVDKYGDWFTYDNNPRAKIFRRDHVAVKDINTMMKLMRYNDFEHDPLSRCECDPPFSAENAIAARCDLNPANGTYPFTALGHRDHGATDMKMTTSSMAQLGAFIAIGCPTFDPLPPFQWSKTDFADQMPHLGHPDLFQFEPVLFRPSLPTLTGGRRLRANGRKVIAYRPA